MKRKDQQFIVEWRSLDAVQPYEGNPRKISQSAVAKVATSLKSFGWRQPIVVDRAGVIIAGHTRRLAAMSLGMTQVPVHVAKDMTDAQARAYRLADNRVAEETKWDIGALGAELSALHALEIDLLDLGFDPVELPDSQPEPLQVDAESVLPLDRVDARICPHCGKAV